MSVREIKREFIGNTVTVDVDWIHAVNFYTVKACYNVTYEDERGSFAKLETELVDEFPYPWDEIERDGGIESVNRDLRIVYGPDPFKRTA